MASADYRSCDVCGCKVFYDCSLNYAFPPYDEWTQQYSVPFRTAGVDDGHAQIRLERLGDWAVLCNGCSKTHKTQIVPIEDSP